MKYQRRSAAETTKEAKSPVAARQHYIFSGPFGGKTTAAAYLRDLGYVVWETDEARRALPGWHHALWSGWRSDSPHHQVWKKLNQLHFDGMRAAYKSGLIVIAHDAPPDFVSIADAVLIDPGHEALVRRAEEFQTAAIDATPEVVRNVTNRYVAALHYWLKDDIRHWAGYRTSTIQQLVGTW